MAVKVLKGENFDDFIKEGNVVIDFYADWCGPCKMLKPIFEEASEKIKNVNFGKVNVDESSDLAQRFMVMSIPTILFFKDGKQIDRHSGVLHIEDIEKKFK